MPRIRWRAGSRAPGRRRIPKPAARPALEFARRPDFRLAVLSGLGALAALVAGSAFGDVHGRALHAKVTALGAALAFMVLGVFAVRRLAATAAAAVSLRTGRGGATALRLVVTFSGYVLVVLAALDLLAVPVQHLLLGGALTGVVLGIVAQQSLGNMFAGLVLLVTRPFAVGDLIRIRAGALGGEFDGVVRTMSLTYVTVDTEDGPLHVPNSGVLAAAVGPRPQGGAVITPARGSRRPDTGVAPQRAAPSGRSATLSGAHRGGARPPDAWRPGQGMPPSTRSSGTGGEARRVTGEVQRGPHHLVGLAAALAGRDAAALGRRPPCPRPW